MPAYGKFGSTESIEHIYLSKNYSIFMLRCQCVNRKKVLFTDLVAGVKVHEGRGGV
jgi:hypothetical protein